MRVVVAGGGISGLTAAVLARAAGHDVVCVDPSSRPGGLIRTERHDGFLCEVGPQAVLDDAPDTRALISALGLDARAVTATAEARRRFIYARGGLQVLPMTPQALLGSRLLSARGKLRLLAEPFIRARARLASLGDDSETVADFATRRLGPEAGRTLLGTGVIGIYAADAALLSIASAFPRLAAMERDHGGLFRGMLAARKLGKRPGRPLSFADGLGELPAALGDALGPAGWVRGRVVAIEPRAGASAWRVVVEGGTTPGLEADVLVLTMAPEETARILAPIAPAARDALTGMPTAPIAACCLGFRDTSAADMGMDLAAYGFLVARGQQPRLLGCQYESSTFPNRAPPGGVLLRAILGGTGPGFQPEIIDMSDERIAEHAVADLKTVAGLRKAPDLVRVWKHPRGLPLYAPGHAARVAALDEALREQRGLFVIGHGLRGLGVNESIRAATALVKDQLTAFAR
jgi:oxygen-dependent protoporphyrinogen oxidase